MRLVGATSLRVRRVTSGVAALLLLGGCTGSPEPEPGDGAQPSAASSQGARAEASRPDRPDVVAVSVDGLLPRALEVLGRGGTPTLHRLIDEGVSTLDARSQTTRTLTLPNHTGMLTGRWVDASTGGHGVTINSRTSRTVHDFAGGYVASVFDVVHDAGGSTALFSSKKKFDIFDRSWSEGAPDVTGEDDGPDKIDEFTVVEDNDRLVAEVVDDLSRHRRALTFVHLSAPDQAGHESGFMGKDYRRAVAETDVRIGRLVERLELVARERPLVLVVTADHGGDGGEHREVTDPANYTVPFVVWGTGVPHGRDLYDLNPSRVDPGDGQVPDQAPRQPVRNADLANLVTSLLGLDPVRGSQFGAESPLVVR